MAAEKCPCGSDKSYKQCCEPIIKGKKAASTAQALMRARYSAYVKTDVDFIHKTTAPKQREGLDERATRAWSEHAKWHSLEILSTEKGGADDDTGVVEFAASYTEADKFKRHHEKARFRKVRGKWFYEDGDMVKQQPVVREAPKVGRNDPCPCGSGKKYKRCCGATKAA